MQKPTKSRLDTVPWNCHPEENIKTLIEQVHQVVTEAKVHQDLPFENLLDTLEVERDPSRHPIYQVMFSLQSFAESIDESKSLPFKTVVPADNEVIHNAAKFDLNMVLTDQQTQISGCINFAVSLFSEQTVEQFQVMYCRVLKAFVADQQQKLSHIELISNQEKEALLYTCSKAESEKSEKSEKNEEESLVQRFTKQAALTPDNVAIVFENEPMSYRELDQKSNQVARAIQSEYQAKYNKALPANTLVGLYLDRSFEMVVSILAVLKVGAAYVPMSPAHKSSENQSDFIKSILSDSQAPLLITQNGYQQKLSDWLNEFKIESGIINLDESIQLQKYSTQYWKNRTHWKIRNH